MAIFTIGQKVLASQLNDMNIERIVANSGFQSVGVASFGTLDVSSSVIADLLSGGSLIVASGTLLAVAPAVPVANEVYRDNIVKAWVDFDGLTVNSSNPVDLTGVNDSFNIAGVQDEGVGRYDIYWETDFAAVNYGIVMTVHNGAGGGATIGVQGVPTVSLARAAIRKSSDQTADDAQVWCMAIGGQ